jgi:hypothetical protein
MNPDPKYDEDDPDYDRGIDRSCLVCIIITLLTFGALWWAVYHLYKILVS